MGDALSPTPTVVLAFDSGPGAGLGHRRRAEALAEALAAGGARIVLHPLSDPARLPVAPVIVVDSYRVRADRLPGPEARSIVAIDDLVRDLAVDLVVDPAPGAEPLDHPSAGRVLAGAHFAPLPASLATLAPAPVGPGVTSVLVAAGGGETATLGVELAATIKRAHPELRVRVALPPDLEVTVPENLEAVRRGDGLGPDLAQADIVVTAGGVTLLEAMCLGRPTITFVLAENQRRQAEGAARLGGAEIARLAAIPAAVERLRSDGALRRTMALRAQEVVDGAGARRVADVICAF